MRMKKRFTGTWILLIILLALISGCTKSKKEFLGKINYSAPIALLEYSVTDEGEFLEYREILDLEQFIIQSDVPILLAIRQINDKASPVVIPKMEEAAVKYWGKAFFVFADIEAEDPFLTSFEVDATPTFHLIDDSSKIMYAKWGEDAAQDKLFKELLKRMDK